MYWKIISAKRKTKQTPSLINQK